MLPHGTRSAAMPRSTTAPMCRMTPRIIIAMPTRSNLVPRFVGSAGVPASTFSSTTVPPRTVATVSAGAAAVGAAAVTSDAATLPARFAMSSANAMNAMT